MKLGFVQLFKAGVAVGLGYELGRIIPGVIIRATNKRFRTDVRAEYRRRMHVVRTETPTGD